MSLISTIAVPYARYKVKKYTPAVYDAVKAQEETMHYLLDEAKDTLFGKEHHFNTIKEYKDYTANIPLRDYEQYKPYIERIKNGEHDILWKGQPLYLAKTSGTTSGVKYIPITNESIPNHINGARQALLYYIHNSGKADFASGKMIFLSGSPELTTTNGILTGRLSGIVNHHIPGYLKRRQLPTWETNCIEDWETKVDKIVEETYGEDMRLISGIPPWVQMYFDKLLARTGKKHVIDVFPNLSLIVHGGVNFEPYRAKLEQTIGAHVPTIETYPASEGFFAFQDTLNEPGLLLNANSGIFFEFVPADEIGKPNPTRVWLKDVELDKNYAIIVNNNAGLWGYMIGDLVRFVNKNPYRLVVSGRVSHYISAFGEHVIGEEVEYAIIEAAKKYNVELIEFTVAPQVNPADGGKPYHEWFVEFGTLPKDMEAFRLEVDNNLRRKNIYYDDLIKGHILQPLVITPMKTNAFIDYMKSLGKLGGQNKVPRLANDRKIADVLEGYRVR